MKLSTIKSRFIEELSSAYETEEQMSFFYILVEEYLGENRFVLHLKPDYEINQAQEEQFVIALKKLKTHKPIQYIIGTTEFLSLKLMLSPSVLIPRPETEDLILYLESKISKIKPNYILDIGTGSGCIGLSLKLRVQEAKVSLMDVSSDALKIAQQNADLNKLEVELIQTDVLSLKELDQSFDLIVSNPPYVRDHEKTSMQSNVLDHEPHLALFVSDQDPLLFYRKIAKLAKDNLNPGGMLCFEINEAYGMETKELLNTLGFKKIELISDRFGKDRIVSAIQ